MARIAKIGVGQPCSSVEFCRLSKSCSGIASKIDGAGGCARSCVPVEILNAPTSAHWSVTLMAGAAFARGGAKGLAS
jgi:hypothetical protein